MMPVACTCVLMLLLGVQLLAGPASAAPGPGAGHRSASNSSSGELAAVSQQHVRHMHQQRRWQLPPLLPLLAAARGNGSGDAQPACEPWSVPSELRCEYVVSHADVCYPRGGWQAYLRVHFCTFQHWQWLSLLLLLAGVLLSLAVVLTLSERFFCPALELISEYLALSPAVAGATLLSFGNGAPDIFTQVAAVGQGGSSGVAMALAEPFGGGLFNTNICFGLVALIAHRLGNVNMQRVPFIKDVSFYLLGSLIIVVLVADEKVALWEACIMGAVYVAYVVVTFYVSRHEEPVHADVALHEVPQEEGIDTPDPGSESFSETPRYLDATTSMVLFDDEEAGSTMQGRAAAAAAAGCAGPFRAALSLREPLLAAQDGLAPASAAAAAERGATTGAVAVCSPGRRRPPLAPARTASVEAGTSPIDSLLSDDVDAIAAAAAAALRQGRRSGGTGSRRASRDGRATPPLPPPPALGAARKFSSFSEGVLLQLPPPPQQPDAGDAAGTRSPTPRSERGAPNANGRASPVGSLPPPLSSPLLRHSSTMRAARSPEEAEAAAAALRAVAPQLVPDMRQLSQLHVQEQEELLQQQEDEHLALLSKHEEKAALARSRARRIKQRLQRPVVQLLSCTMPRVSTGHGHHYKRWRACLLPLTAGLPLLLMQPALLDAIGLSGLLYGLLVAAISGAIIYATYPASNMPRKTLKGVFAVMTFFQSIAWLNLVSGAMVQMCVLLGVIGGLPPPLLGATVLAWGNSVPDLVNNLALARDGFPSMAVAACFASPLFTLLVGVGGALAAGAIRAGGSLAVPLDSAMVVMMGFGLANLCKWLLLVPFAYRFRMSRTMAFAAFSFYGVYNVVYGLASAGVLVLPGRSGGRL